MNIRMQNSPAKWVAVFLFFVSLSKVALAQTPPNDDCAGAISLLVNSDNSCTSLYSGSTGYSTQTAASCVSSGYSAKDVWFKFVATSSTHRITVSPVNFDDFVYQVYSGTCGSLNSLACVNTGSTNQPDVSLVNNLVAGETYFIRVYDYFGGGSPTRQFTVCISTTTSLVNNDDCSGALNVTPEAGGNCSNFVTVNNTGATQSAAGCYGSAEDDIWFKFTATSNRHRIRVSTDNNISPVLEIFNGSCGSLTTLACRYTSTGSAYSFIDADITTFTPGVTYYFRVYGTAPNNARTNISVCIASPPAGPANDECSGAIALNVNSDNSCTSSWSGNMGYPTQSMPSCVSSGYDARDVWFKFVATASSHRITVSPLTYNNYVFEVFGGACGSLTSLACVNTGSSNEPDAAILNNLVPGNTYYTRVYDYFGAGSVSMQFNICVSTTTQLVDNDDCAGALNVVPQTGDACQDFVTVNNTGATQSMPGCFGTAEDDVWFKFTATSTRHRIRISTSDDINPVLQVFDGSCGALVPIACRYINDGSSYWLVDFDMSTFVVGHTYYFRTYGSAANTQGTNISACITTLPAGPSNDECGGAISLSVNADNSCASVYNGNIGYATQSLASCLSSSYDAKDVWFKFVATSFTHRITATPVSYDDFVMEVYSGACGALTSLACINTGGLNEPDLSLLNNLTPGSTYFVRVYERYGSASPSLQFNICLSTTTTLVNNDDCSGALAVTPCADVNCSTFTTVNNTGATPSIAACFGSAEDDVWFQFTATSTRHRIVVNTNEDISPVLQVFDGSCGAISPLSCHYTNNGNAYSFIDADLNNLTVGHTYFYRVYGSGANNLRTNISTAIGSFASLPVSLAAFTIIAGQEQHQLKWQTESESNNTGFDVQYSRDGLNFKSIAFVNSQAINGNSSGLLNYSYRFNITNEPAGSVYYRLKQVDLDGRFSYSETVAAKITVSSSITVYPNPTAQVLYLKLGGGTSYKFIIQDMMGRTQYQGNLQSNFINVSTLSKGSYVLSLLNGSERVVLRFIKQ